MDSNKENLEQKIVTKKYNWKKELLKKTIDFTIITNIVYGIFSYGYTSEGFSREKIDSMACISYYNAEQNKYIPFKGPLYWLTEPGREIGLFIYERNRK